MQAALNSWKFSKPTLRSWPTPIPKRVSLTWPSFSACSTRTTSQNTCVFLPFLLLLSSRPRHFQVSFDLSLARGLDYYTGIIYEAIVEASAPPGFKTEPAVISDPTLTPAPSKPNAAEKKQHVDEEGELEVDENSVGVGSIAAGGRYDNLVQLFTSAAAGDSKAGKKAPGLPCVGVSIGIDRVFALLWPKWVERGGRSKETVAYVMAAGDGLLEDRIKLVTELRAAGVKVCIFVGML